MKLLIPAIVLILISVSAHAQEKKGDTAIHDFKAREVIIFEDDFGEDTVRAFPSKWQVMATTPYIWRYADTMFHVEKDNLGKYLKVVNNALPKLEPTQKYSLGDSFSVEIEFLLESFNANISSLLTDDSETKWIHDSLDSRGQFECHAQYKNTRLSAQKETNIPGFDRLVWHRLAITHQKQETKFYVDDSKVYTLTGVDIAPHRFFIIPKGPVKIRRVRLATGSEAIPIESLLSDKKFTTHTILFDINKSSIRHTSLPFINQLARFLKKNPKIRLEIDGHTDSDGDAVANMKLSKNRADEIKRQLVSAGIDSKRLTTKGFGASKPLQPNTTAESKANNRRVEFIKL